MKLYSYFRSSASYRVRIALALKGLSYEYAAVHLLKGGGQQLSSVYRSLNPDSLVPTLEDGPQVLTQSLAIIEYLNDLHPEPPLLPSETRSRARRLRLLSRWSDPTFWGKILPQPRREKRQVRRPGILWTIFAAEDRQSLHEKDDYPFLPTPRAATASAAPPMVSSGRRS